MGSLGEEADTGLPAVVAIVDAELGEQLDHPERRQDARAGLVGPAPAAIRTLAGERLPDRRGAGETGPGCRESGRTASGELGDDDRGAWIVVSGQP